MREVDIGGWRVGIVARIEPRRWRNARFDRLRGGPQPGFAELTHPLPQIAWGKGPRLWLDRRFGCASAAGCPHRWARYHLPNRFVHSAGNGGNHAEVAEGAEDAEDCTEFSASSAPSAPRTLRDFRRSSAHDGSKSGMRAHHLPRSPVPGAVPGGRWLDGVGAPGFTSMRGEDGRTGGYTPTDCAPMRVERGQRRTHADRERRPRLHLQTHVGPRVSIGESNGSQPIPRSHPRRSVAGVGSITGARRSRGRSGCWWRRTTPTPGPPTRRRPGGPR